MTGCPVLLPPVSGSTVGGAADAAGGVARGLFAESADDVEVLDVIDVVGLAVPADPPAEHAEAVTAKTAIPAARASCCRCFIEVITRNATVSRMATPLSQLNAAQRALVEQWLPGARVVADHSWGLVDNVVLELAAGGEHFIVKADGESAQHIPRELIAHAQWLAPWVAAGRAPRLVAGEPEAGVLVTAYLPGELVLGADAQQDPDTFRQAGELLAILHGQTRRTDASYEAQENAKILRNLDKPHRIAPTREAELREIVSSWTTEPVVLVPCHGDWQPRNWLVHDGRLSVIDFGRAAMRPALSDWLRLEARDFRDHAELENAFVEGYGADPREPVAWFRERLREAINTAVWAHLVGDETFETQGHEMLDRVLAD